MRLTALAVTAVLLAASPALADEVWNSNRGEIVWLDTRGADAIFALHPTAGGEPVYMVVQGLGAHVSGGRGTYTGLWMTSEGATPCAAEMIDPSGGKTTHWGSVTLTFVNESFPSDFAGAIGACLDRPSLPLQARAVVGEQ